MSDHNHLHWLIRLPIVLLRSLTLVGAVVCMAGMGILTMMPIRLVIGMSEQVGDLLGPVVWCVRCHACHGCDTLVAAGVGNEQCPATGRDRWRC